MKRGRTKPLGQATKNFPVNWADAELAAMRAEAHRRDLSVGALIRHWGGGHGIRIVTYRRHGHSPLSLAPAQA